MFPLRLTGFRAGGSFPVISFFQFALCLGHLKDPGYLFHYLIYFFYLFYNYERSRYRYPDSIQELPT